MAMLFSADQASKQFSSEDPNGQKPFSRSLQQVAQVGDIQGVLQEAALWRSVIADLVREQINLSSKDELIETQARLNAELDEQLSVVIKELVEKQTARLMEQAYRDPITGLRNRLAFDVQLQDEMTRARRYARSFSLALFDVDDFKSVNDGFGHLAGDQLLMSIAQCIQSSLRKSDSCFRYGGDEFAAICPETSSQAMAGAIQRLRNELRLNAEKYRALQLTTISYGIATFPDDTEDGQELIKLADEKLYAYKRRTF